MSQAENASMSEAEMAAMRTKAASYDALHRKCEDRQVAAMKALGKTTSGYEHAPVEAVLAAFDKLTKR